MRPVSLILLAVVAWPSLHCRSRESISDARDRQAAPPPSALAARTPTRASRAIDVAGEFFTEERWSFPLDSFDVVLEVGRANVKSDDGHRAERTALCARDEGRTLDVVLARSAMGGPSLFALAQHLASEGCEHALNLVTSAERFPPNSWSASARSARFVSASTETENVSVAPARLDFFAFMLKV